MFRSTISQVVRSRPTSTPYIRSFVTSQPKLFLENLFGTKELKKREEIVKQQDDFEIDPNANIVILNEENSKGFQPFDPEVDLAGFKVEQWKSKVVKTQDIESTYTNQDLINIINSTYKQTKSVDQDINEADFKSVDLYDLSFRFQFFKQLQSNLGFDINDYVISKTHDLNQVYEELSKVISQRWVWERNPNGIVLRNDDFKAGNVYLSQELNEKDQAKVFESIVEEINSNKDAEKAV
ncbi:ribosomal subunit 39S-domain-containing protein [Scheffersomyces coipomensis]|uniref:ribosomal subunit 39S-domain-containing protein n=1 Tax=Scheffersomyces coipomensis TaxID=1788519 RepID=UPI00315CA5F2